MRAAKSAAALATVVLGFMGAPARAADGRLEIGAACAAVGCFPGDAPDLPVTLAFPGSYVLIGNLGVADPTRDGIEITANGVSVDLNGFEIAGPVVCFGSGGGLNCAVPPLTGAGIDAAAASGVSISNGRVKGFGSDGVVTGARARIEGVLAEANGISGIRTGGDSVISRCTAHRNGGALMTPPPPVAGIEAGDGSIVEHSIASANRGDGIKVARGSSVLGCTASLNGDDGIEAASGSPVLASAAYANWNRGFGLSNGGIVHDSAAHLNGGIGIFAGQGSSVSENLGFDNTGNGITVQSGAMVQSCVAAENGGFGITLGDDATFRENTVDDNTGGTISGGEDLGANACNGALVCP